jgi:HEAT repeat protein
LIPRGLANHPDAGRFARTLQEAHLDEIGFLLGHRAVQLGLGRWRGIDKIERRVVAHLAAVAAHGRTALEVAAEAFKGDDPSSRAGAAYAIAALGDAARRAELFSAPAALDEANFDALALAPSPAFVSDLEGLIGAENEPVALVAARIVGKRRETRLERLLDLAATVESDAVLAALAIGLAKTGSRAVWPVLNAAMRRNPDDARLVFGMVVANDPQGLSLARAWLADSNRPLAARDRNALIRAIAVAGDVHDIHLLAQQAREAPTVALQALGLLGAPGAVDAIMPHLESKDASARRAAGLALELLTRASLPAAVPVAEDEPADDELEDAVIALEANAFPVCTDPVAWRAYWAANGERFSERAQRYRRGQVWSVAASLDGLSTLPLSLGQRQLESDELAARTGHPAFEGDWPLPRQLQHFDESRTRISERRG